MFETFSQADHYAIHILRKDQEELSNHFASKSPDKFAELAYETGLSGLPLLPDYVARLQCKVEHRYAGGNHIILVGQILEMQHIPGDPLIFHDSQYKSLA